MGLVLPPPHLLFLTFSLLSLTLHAHNITTILSAFPNYSQFNSYLTQTKLADEINNRQPVTVLVVTNGELPTLVTGHPISVIKNALSLHILLDYFDDVKLHKIHDGTVLSTTLYQTTGLARGQVGFVNITDLRGGKVGFGSAVPGSVLDSTYTKEVKKLPYSLSVVEISKPIIALEIMNEPSPVASEVNITDLLVKAGCKTFVSKIVSTGVIKTYETTAAKGLTIFAPSDEAFKAKDVPDLNKLTNPQLVTLLQYHALASYSPIGTLKSTKFPMSTLATGGPRKYTLRVTTAGDEVTLHAGLDSSRVAQTVIDTTPLCIYKVDNVLLPAELFGTGPSQATSPASALATSPASAPVPGSVAAGPAAVPPPHLSPPGPAVETPENAPAESPADAPSEAADSDSVNAAVGVRVSVLLTGVVSAILSLFLGWLVI